jgi:hypothetical protein
MRELVTKERYSCVRTEPDVGNINYGAKMELKPSL